MWLAEVRTWELLVDTLGEVTAHVDCKTGFADTHPEVRCVCLLQLFQAHHGTTAQALVALSLRMQKPNETDFWPHYVGHPGKTVKNFKKFRGHMEDTER